jgi:hypothetical protein
VYERGLIELEQRTGADTVLVNDPEQQRESCVMSHETRTGVRSTRFDNGELQAELVLPLDELVRRGTRDILQWVIESEVAQRLAEVAWMSLMDGRQSVVRNGDLPAREILATVGAVAVPVPKVRDRSGASVRFNSALVPPHVRRSSLVAAALPWRYLIGISGGDLGEVLEGLLGEDAKGLSAAVFG